MVLRNRVELLEQELLDVSRSIEVKAYERSIGGHDDKEHAFTLE